MNRVSSPEIDWITTPDSSNIAAFGYHHARNLLIIDFKDKHGNTTQTYTYPNVPSSLFADMKAAESAGKFFSAHVRNAFDGTISTDYDRPDT